MRIEQPARLRPLHVESFRRGTRLGVRGVILGLFMSAFPLGILALRASGGGAVERWQWLGCAGLGPMGIGLTKLTLWLCSVSDRFAEIRGDRVTLGGIGGHRFRPSHLVSCSIEPDHNSPGVYHLCFCFRPSRFSRPASWTMMVEDLDEAEDFRRELVARSGTG